VYDPKRTQVAQSLVDFGKYFDTIFERTRVGGAVPLRPMLVVPDDMSTDGGKRARQSVTLQPEVPGVPALTVGWIDIPGRQAMMRTWNALAAMHRQRFPGRPFDLDRATYEGFFRQFIDLVKTCGLTSQFEDDPADGVPMSGPGSAPGGGALAGPIASNRPRPPQASGYGGGVVAIVGLAGFLVGAVAGGAAVWFRLAGH